MLAPEPLRRTAYGKLPVAVFATNEALGQAAAAEACEILNDALAARGEANLILASANSQLTFLTALRTAPVDWPRVRLFHMDEYLGLPPEHPAGFAAFLRRHFADFVSPLAFHALPTTGDGGEYSALLAEHPADLVAMGWGENGHIAFNDPPEARFADPELVKVVRLAEASRRQQVGEGHFRSLAEVPTHALTLTIPALLAAKRILCLVPEKRKAAAVRACLAEPISEARPGSILREAAHARLFLDQDSAALL